MRPATKDQERKDFESWWDSDNVKSDSGPWEPNTAIQYAWAGWLAAKSSCFGRENCKALANAVLDDMHCHPAFVKALAKDE